LCTPDIQANFKIFLFLITLQFGGEYGNLSTLTLDTACIVEATGNLRVGCSLALFGRKIQGRKLQSSLKVSVQRLVTTLRYFGWLFF
jgi:hypothetical protein